MQIHYREGEGEKGTAGNAVDGGACGGCQWAAKLAEKDVGLLALAGGASKIGEEGGWLRLC